MIMRIQLSWWKGNLLAVITAIVLSGMVYIALINMNALQANVNPSPSFVDQSDLSVTVEGEFLYVELVREIDDLESLSFLVFYNPDEVVRDSDAIQSEFAYSVAQWNNGEATVILTFWDGEWTLRAGTQLIEIWVNGNPHEMTVSDAVFAFANGSEERWSIAVQ